MSEWDDKRDFQGAIQAWEDFLMVVPFEDERVTMVKQEIEVTKTTLSMKKENEKIFRGGRDAQERSY
jgi:cytochrome c-type biogenesis protein CcmH/NrfG